MPKRFISPSLADLSQDIAGDIPVDLVESWADSDGDEKSAEKILGKYKVRGTLVSSDTSGLSKLSQEKDLLEVLKIISDPKEIVFGLGCSIGGRGVGKWIADNTQMFFDENIAVVDVVNAIFEANQRINENCLARLGFCIHYGEFLDFGGGIWGDEADFMEMIAENHAGGGEVLITETVKKLLDKNFFHAKKKELEIETPESVFVLENASGLPDKEISATDYPIYFDQRFFELLKNLDEKTKAEIYHDYAKKKIIVLIQKISNIETQGHIGLLDEMVENTIFSSIVKKVGKECSAQKIKVAGNLGIFAFEIDEMEKAIEFAKKIRSELKLDSLESIIGIESGEVLLFPLENNQWDIAGSPVNIASKQAQDIGKPGGIYITKNAIGTNLTGAKPYKKEVSRVVLEGWVL